MMRFLITGILRDKNRSVLPATVIAIGVMLTVLFSAWFKGVFTDMIDVNANFSSGHNRVMTRAYAENESQRPNDLAILGVDTLLSSLHAQFPDMAWVPRIHFGGILDVPDARGETRGQGIAVGQAIDFFSDGTREPERMNIPGSIVMGALPRQSGDALVSHDFAERFGLKPGDAVTLFGSTMEGGMSFSNFTISGTVRFGMQAMDRGAILIDLSDARAALDMEDAAGEILGFLNTGKYDEARALSVKEAFNQQYASSNDEFAPVMQRLNDQNSLEEYLAISRYFSGVMVLVLVLALSIVLWNTGLIGGLRRYNEFGIRLAMGEDKGHVFRSLLQEALVIGLMGSVVGTLVGLAGAWYLETYGINLGSAVQGGSMMMPEVFRASISPLNYWIGFIPGVFSVLFGNALAGIGIFRRSTATLFKELSV
jgi:putative ABC transport system permease protein